LQADKTLVGRSLRQVRERIVRRFVGGELREENRRPLDRALLSQASSFLAGVGASS
jgi:hypothetical protein